MKNKKMPFCSPVTYDLVRWAVSQKSVAAVIRSISLYLAHRIAKFTTTKNMNMQMPNRLATVLTLVGYETETVLKSELIGERRELFEAFRKGLGLRVAHFDDVCVMLFRDKQKMHGRLRIEVLYDYHILVLIDFCGRNIPFYDFAENAVVHIMLQKFISPSRPQRRPDRRASE